MRVGLIRVHSLVGMGSFACLVQEHFRDDEQMASLKNFLVRGSGNPTNLYCTALCPIKVAMVPSARAQRKPAC
jgi:hypothetical protein